MGYVIVPCRVTSSTLKVRNWQSFGAVPINQGPKKRKIPSPNCWTLLIRDEWTTQIHLISYWKPRNFRVFNFFFVFFQFWVRQKHLDIQQNIKICGTQNWDIERSHLQLQKSAGTMVLPLYPLELSKSQSRTNGKNQRKRRCLEEMEPTFPAFRRENIWNILVGATPIKRPVERGTTPRGLAITMIINHLGNRNLTLPETNSKKHLKMDGWKMSVSFWDDLFSGYMLVLGSVDLTYTLAVRLLFKSFFQWFCPHTLGRYPQTSSNPNKEIPSETVDEGSRLSSRGYMGEMLRNWLRGRDSLKEFATPHILKTALKFFLFSDLLSFSTWIFSSNFLKKHMLQMGNGKQQCRQDLSHATKSRLDFQQKSSWIDFQMWCEHHFWWMIRWL